MNTLHLRIWKDDSIRNIQEKFSELFSGLQIRIFKHIDDKSGFPGQDIMFCPEVRMIDLNSRFQNDMLNISGSLTVSDLEQAFLDKFGLFVQVFRKNGNAIEESNLLCDFLSEKINYRIGKFLHAYDEGVYGRRIQFGH